MLSHLFWTFRWLVSILVSALPHRYCSGPSDTWSPRCSLHWICLKTKFSLIVNLSSPFLFHERRHHLARWSRIKEGFRLELARLGKLTHHSCSATKLSRQTQNRLLIEECLHFAHRLFEGLSKSCPLFQLIYPLLFVQQFVLCSSLCFTLLELATRLSYHRDAKRKVSGMCD